MLRKARNALVVTALFAGGGMALARLLGYRLGRNTVVRCRRGDLFTTTWIPGIKLKAVDLGIARFQWCPVGRHWSLVVPVRPASLTDDERAEALAHHDVRLP